MQTDINVMCRINVYEFATRYRTVEEEDAEGNKIPRTIGVDWVNYGPSGADDRMKLWAPVSTLICSPDWETRGYDVTSYAPQWQRSIADIVRPQYEAWKSGQEYTSDETPLAAAGFQVEQVKRFHIAGIRSVERLANANHNELQKVSLPDVQAHKATARRFLDMRHQVAAANKVAEMEQQNEALQHRLAEMEQMMQRLMAAQQPDGKPKPPEDDDEELAALRELAKENGIKYTEKKKKDTLERELEALMNQKVA